MVSPVNDAPDGRTSNTSHWLSGSPGINIGKLVMTESKSDLFHDDTLMRDLRIRVSYRKKLAYTFHIADQQDIRQRAY